MKKKHNEKTPAEAVPEEPRTGWENAVEADPAAVGKTETETPDLSPERQMEQLYQLPASAHGRVAEYIGGAHHCSRRTYYGLQEQDP